MSTPNIEHERKYTIDLLAFYNWAQPYMTRGIISMQEISQWYVPEKLRKDGIMRVRRTTRNRDHVVSELTIKIPTDDPAVRREYNFTAPSSFQIIDFVADLGIEDNIVTKDRWDITRAWSHTTGIKFPVGVEIIVDFFRKTNAPDSEIIATLEIENPPAGWEPPFFALKDVTSDISYTNYAMAVDPKN